MDGWEILQPTITHLKDGWNMLKPHKSWDQRINHIPQLVLDLATIHWSGPRDVAVPVAAEELSLGRPVDVDEAPSEEALAVGIRGDPVGSINNAGEMWWIWWIMVISG